jgi:hypothetical protein
MLRPYEACVRRLGRGLLGLRGGLKEFFDANRILRYSAICCPYA